MLAACTIGPGTVVVCSKAGAEYDTRLVWTLIVASFVAFVLQEASARLTLITGMSFGQAMCAHFGSGDYWGSDRQRSVPCVAHVAVVLVLVGNTAYQVRSLRSFPPPYLFFQANNLVGAVAALFVLYEEILWFRITAAFVTGAITSGVLIFLPMCCGDGSIDLLGQSLGVVVLLMTAVFAAAATDVDIDGEDFGRNLIPTIPGGAAETVVAMIGTTAVPFNIFLAASLTQTAGAKGGSSGSACSCNTNRVEFDSLLGDADLMATPLISHMTTEDRVRDMQRGESVIHTKTIDMREIFSHMIFLYDFRYWIGFVHDRGEPYKFYN